MSGLGLRTILWPAYWLGSAATFVYLTFFDDFTWTWWNWILVIPINTFIASIWPIYWLVLHWLPLYHR